jgi:hypothetical protein
VLRAVAPGFKQALLRNLRAESAAVARNTAAAIDSGRVRVEVAEAQERFDYYLDGGSYYAEWDFEGVRKPDATAGNPGIWMSLDGAGTAIRERNVFFVRAYTVEEGRPPRLGELRDPTSPFWRPRWTGLLCHEVNHLLNPGHPSDSAGHLVSEVRAYLIQSAFESPQSIFNPDGPTPGNGSPRERLATCFYTAASYDLGTYFLKLWNYPDVAPIMRELRSAGASFPESHSAISSGEQAEMDRLKRLVMVGLSAPDVGNVDNH